MRLKDIPVPYFKSAIITTAVASTFSVPADGGSPAVNISPQALQRSLSISDNGRFQRRLSHKADQRRRFFLAIHSGT
jgi:hypothetical protein